MSEQTITPEVNHSLELNNEMTERRSKLAALRAQGNPFPNDFRRDSLSGDLHAEFDDKSAEELTSLGKRVKIAGRIMTRRIMGKASFATLQDMAGKIQVYVTRDDLPEGFYNEQFKKWDLGDIVGVEGTLFKTQTGELSVHVSDIRLLTKALRPLPEKHKGLTDQEARCRQRYLDLIANEESRKTFMIRTQVVAGIRKFFNEKRFMEVETPMMQVIPGGASARPFVTHHNALDIDMYLRIAPELYLKRLVVGGFERVYEINRNFRNEGISVRHNPEFTMIEFYMAYADYIDSDGPDRRAAAHPGAGHSGRHQDPLRQRGRRGPDHRFRSAVPAPHHGRVHPEVQPGCDPGRSGYPRERQGRCQASAHRADEGLGAGPRDHRDLRRDRGAHAAATDLHHRVPGSRFSAGSP